MSASLTTSGITMPTGGTLGDSSSAAPIYAARAWVNFNGTTVTPSTIRGSGNVSSITRSGTGSYVVNLATALPGTDHAIIGLTGGSASRPTLISSLGTTTTAAFNCSDSQTGQGYDQIYSHCVVFK